MQKVIPFSALLIVLSGACGRQMPFDLLRVGNQRVTFNATMTLKQVAAMLGKADTNTRGDASESQTWLCYRAAAAGDTATLAVESDEIGGGVHVTSFDLFRLGADSGLERHCALLHVAPRSIVTDRGITLGMTRSQVQRVLGRATRDSAGVAAYEWSRERRGRVGTKENQGFSEGSHMQIWYVDGIVVRISGDRMDIS